MDKQDLRALQMVELEALLEVDRICEKYDITYYLVGGSTLGAVRHQGFIPWDDDVDISMERDQYNAFCQACVKDLSPRFFLQNYRTEPNFRHFYSKLRVNGTTYLQKNTMGDQVHQGIGIDIFPLDHCLDDAAVFARLLKKIRFYNTIRINPPSRPFAKRLFVGLVNLFIPKKRAIALMEKQLCAYNQTDTGYITNYGGAYGFREVMPWGCYGRPVKMLFEGHMLPVPEQTDAFLIRLYNDYMRLPDDRDQIGHDTVKMDTRRDYKEYLKG